MSFGRRGTILGPSLRAFSANSPAVHAEKEIRKTGRSPSSLAISAAALFSFVVLALLVLSKVHSPRGAPQTADADNDNAAYTPVDDAKQVGDIFAKFPNTTVTYYSVDGRSAQAIRASLDSVRPTDPHDHLPADGHSIWTMDWRWPGNGSNGCDLADTTVTFRSEVILPRHVSEASLDPAVLKAWQRYVIALANHEAGHIQHAYDHVDDVRNAVRSSACGDANAAGLAAVKGLAQFDVDYDAATHHGASQGAIFR